MPEFVTLANGQSGLRLDYHFSETATAFIMDRTFITGYFGPFGCSKTAALCWKAWLYAQAYPGSRVGLLRNTWPNLRDTTMAEFFKWWPPGIAGHFHKTDKIFELYGPQGPSSIYFRHMDTEDDIRNTLSLNLDAMGFDEPQGGLSSTGGIDPGISVNLYRALIGRLGRDATRPEGLAWLVGNPPSPDHWIANEFGYEGAGAPTNPYPDKRLYLGTRADNQRNLKVDYYERLERIWGRNTPMARRFLYGEWVSFGVERPFHKAWLRYAGMDGEPELPPPTYVDAEGRVRTSYVVEAGIDLAISIKDTAARTAYVIAAQSRHPETRGRIFVLEAAAGHWSVWEQARRVLMACRRHKVRTLRIEDVAYQAAFKDIMEREARASNMNLGLELVKPDGDKLRRSNAWSPLVEDATILFPAAWAPVRTAQGEDFPEEADLLKCMLAVPGDPSKWDPVDAGGLCIRGFPAIQPMSEPIPGTEQVTPELAESYAGGTQPQTLRPKGTADPWRPRVSSELERAKGYASRRPGAPTPRRKGWR